MTKKLIIISYDFPPLDGGIARLCQEIATGQSANFSEVLVLTTDRAGDSFTYNFNHIQRIEFPSKRGKCELAMVKYLRSLPNKDRYTLLAATWHPEGLIAYLSGFKNLFILGHGTELLAGNSKFRQKLWLPLYAKFILSRAKAIISNSHYTASIVTAISPRSNSIPLPLAVNEAFFKPSSTTNKHPELLTFSTVSRIEKFKGHDFIANVIAKLPAEIKQNIRWNIAGRGPDLSYVKQVVSDLGLNANVNFHGFVSDEDLPAFYNKSDLFILCSRESTNTITVEGFGLVFLEAQSCGIPAIGTKTGGIPDAIAHGNGGWLIAQDDEQELIALIKRLYYDRKEVAQQSLNARNRVLEACTWKIYNNNLYNILNISL